VRPAARLPPARLRPPVPTAPAVFVLIRQHRPCHNPHPADPHSTIHLRAGTGKTSLCKALAHKLAIRLSGRYPSAQLIEINAHSLFSRWFSESGKLVHR
jgi:hypothetical protein